MIVYFTSKKYDLEVIPTEAFHKLETLERTAKIIWIAKQLGEITPFVEQEVKEINNLREEQYSLDYPIMSF
jgi:ribulose-5-phosphate 4-epimerase/fuculose-1-phosphate aldolase